TITGCGTAALNVSHQATCTTSSLPVGSNQNIAAAYGGDGSFNTSTSGNLTQTVNRANTTTTVALTSGANPSLFGASVTFTATVADSSANSTATPTGSVTWSGNTACASSALNGSGQATCTTTSLPVGTDTVTATYAQTTNFNGSSGSTTQTVALAPAITSANLVSFGVGAT